jgi:hypothetical protein
MAMLASRAETGCPASTAQLIARAKETGSDDVRALAVKAEGGCPASTAKLIAAYKPAAETATR